MSSIEYALTLTENAELYIILGQLNDAVENYADALGAYKRALTYAPRSMDIRHQIRLTHKLMQLTQKHTASYEAVDTYIDAAQIFLEKHLPNKALHILRRGIRVFPHNTELLCMLGNVYYQHNKFKLAYRFYCKAASKGTAHKPEDIHYNIGLACVALEQWDNAYAEWQACIRMAPHSQAGLRARANMEILNKKTPFPHASRKTKVLPSRCAHP